MAIHSPPNSPNKRIKTLTPDSKISTIVKQELDGSDSVSRCCGICLCDDRNGIRGEIDSCDHYFCFVCVMEWAKIESRCPMCKRRFTAIRRPPKDGVFSSERIVEVPKRDQVFHLSGNTTMEHFDPYAQVQCSVCHTASDECLLLLCDLCDSAAHTYCVGLGVTVPEGDWFCHDCTLSRNEHDNIQKDDDNEILNVKFEVTPPSELCVSTFDVGLNIHSTSDIYTETGEDAANVSIFDIVCESDNSSIGRPSRTFSSGPSPSRGQSNLACDASKLRERTPRTGQGQKVLQSDARTLTQCRNVHGYVRALHQNWDALQSGFLRFSSSSVECSSRSIVKRRSLPVTEDSLEQSHDPSSTSIQQLATDSGLPGICSQDVPRDAKKAWKMMEKAKSIQQACRRTRSISCVSETSSRTGNAISGSTSSHSSRSQQVGTSRFGNLQSEKQYKLYSPEKLIEKAISPKLKTLSNGVDMTKEIVESSDNLPATSGVSSNSATSFTRRNFSLQIQQPASQENLCRDAVKFTNQRNGSGSSMPSIGPVSIASKSLKANADFGASLFQKVHIPEGHVRLENGCTDRKARDNDSAKAEIQSLVKLNLKLLKGVEKIGADAFKEVARLATHTILAACGFEHSRQVVRTCPKSVCSHLENIEQLHKSTLMPNSCRECFYVFVKEVVNSVLSEKLFHAHS